MTGGTTRAPRRSALRAWLVVRVALATAVLGLAYSLFSPDAGVDQTETTLIIEGIVAFAITTSFVIATFVERGGSPVHAGVLLLVLDTCLVSASIGVTGGAGSVLAPLYGAVIVGAATVLGSRAGYFAGALAILCYGTIGVGMALAILPHPSDQSRQLYQLPPNDLLFAMSSNLAAMALVAVFSSWLAMQLAQTDGALARSETDVERLARRNQAIVRSIRSGLLTLDRSGRVTSTNPAALELLGTTEEAMFLRPVTDFFPQFLDERVTPESRAETEGRRSDGSTFPAGFAVSLLEGDDAQGIESLLTFQDLTEIRKLEAVAHDAAQLATLGRVAATLAHEIRNPLGSISGSVELVHENETLPAEDKHLLGIVVREVERIDQLVRDMLDVARTREPRFEDGDLGVLCREVALLASRSADGPRTVVIDGPESFVATFDPDMIRQVVWNLVTNATQATPPDGSVTVRLHRADDGGFEFLVDDDGPGLPEEQLERIFDPFHTRRARGVGLGLALVRQVVGLHGGTVSASNRASRGARFTVRIPKLAVRPSSDPDLAPRT